MLLTILLLIFTVIVIPFVCINFGTPPNEFQEYILWKLSYWVVGVIAYCFFVERLREIILKSISYGALCQSFIPGT